jgi:hypothetical protein
VQTSIASNANGILQRSPAGVWSSMGSVTGGFGVYSIVRGLDGLIYIGGDFTPSAGAGVASWNPATSTFSAMGTGAAGGLVYQLAVMPDGSIIAVGTFTSMGGVANTNKVAKWCQVAARGRASAALCGHRAALRGGRREWHPVRRRLGLHDQRHGGQQRRAVQRQRLVGGRRGHRGRASHVADCGRHHAVRGGRGQRGVQVQRHIVVNIGATAGGDATSLAVDAAGNVYAAGAFTSIGGVSANRIAKYNGVAWFPLGTGLNSSVNLRALSFDNRGLLYVGGDFTTAGGITTPTGSAIWNGAAWVYSDIIPAATARMFGALALPNGQLYQGTINGGSAIGPGTATVTNTGTARAYPTLTITGPSSEHGAYLQPGQRDDRAQYLSESDHQRGRDGQDDLSAG